MKTLVRAGALGLLLATATTAMFSINNDHRPTRLPAEVTRLLSVAEDPIKV